MKSNLREFIEIDNDEQQSKQQNKQHILTCTTYKIEPKYDLLHLIETRSSLLSTIDSSIIASKWS